MKCGECGKKLTEGLWPFCPHEPIRSRFSTEWHPSESITVFRKPDGTYSYPMRSDKPTPPGCERVVIRSDRELAKHEQQANVLSERRWFDKGSGKGFDDTYRGERYD